MLHILGVEFRVRGGRFGLGLSAVSCPRLHAKPRKERLL